VQLRRLAAKPLRYRKQITNIVILPVYTTRNVKMGDATTPVF
jgi:hypothetical protein